jgi:serine/threonine protein kinase
LKPNASEPYGIGVKITDFGLSKEAPNDSASLSASHHESLSWNAPEILVAKNKIVTVCYLQEY